MKNKKWKFGLIVASLAIFALSHTASASWLSDWVEDWGSDKTSFTDFEGDFAPPDPDNYPDKLTKSTNLRDYILQITNFVLSFLGLAAVIAVIYGGILYVTSGGGDEQTGKGKKTVQYAIVGLVVVLISYALVNTVIEGAGTGQEPDSNLGGTSGAAGDQVISPDAASEIQDIGEGVEDAYLSYAAKNDMVAQTASFIEGKIDGSADYANNLSTFKSILSEVKGNVSSIAKGTGDLSETSEKAQEIISEIDQMLAAKIEYPLDGATILEANVLFATAGCPGDAYNQTLCDLQNQVEELSDALETDFGSLMGEFAETLRQFGENYTDLAIANDFESIADNIEHLSISSSNNTVRGILEDIADLSAAASEISTVQAVITATATKGTAPLTIYFDSFKSTDPADGVISDNQNLWDLNGDGQYASSSQTDCQEVKASRVSCSYKEAGVYTVSLKIESADPDNVVSGIASIKITIEPSRSKIVLIGETTTGIEVTLADYTKDPRVDLASWKISEAEAKNGITLDASKTKDGDGNSMKAFTWQFGDGSKPMTEGTGIQPYKYGEAGQYAFELEVEDQLGNKDRKTLTIYVGSPAARITVIPEKGNLETVFSFDGSSSRADEGQIIMYEWTFTENGYTVKKNEENFQYTFAKPGTYEVHLKVYDSSDKSDETIQKVEVSSKEPVPIMDYKRDDPYNPSRVELSGEQSYDEDAGDSIKSYLWKIAGEDGLDPDLEYLSGNKNTSKATVEFFSKGKKEVTLTVEDTFGVKKSVTKTIDIPSILDVYFTVGSADPEQEELVYQLIQGSSGELEAVVDFYPVSQRAKAFEIRFGDGENDFMDAGTQTISHAYTEADSFSVKLIAFDSENNENSITKKIAITAGENPVAMMTVKEDGAEVFETSAEGYKTSIFEFDAGQSIGKNGEKTNLSYLWKFSAVDTSCTKTDIGSGAEVSRQKTDRRSFQDIGCYLVKVTVSDGVATDESDIFQIKIQGALPTFETITVSPQSSDLETPLKVSLKAVGAKDPDGKIAQYKWWYYPRNFGNQGAYQKGTQLTEDTGTTLTISTHDDFDTDKNGKIEYGFALEVKDEDGNTLMKDSESGDILTLEVYNGENEDPEVKLRADRTSIYVNEYVTFTADAEDEDGSIVKYEWDLNGDGAFQEGSNTKAITYQFTAEAEKGIQIRVRVYDDRGAFADSSSVTIYVDKKN